MEILNLLQLAWETKPVAMMVLFIILIISLSIYVYFSYINRDENTDHKEQNKHPS